MNTQKQAEEDIKQVNSTTDGLSPSDLARALAAQRQRVTGHCIVCGKDIEGVQRHGEIHRLYCSHRCAKQAYRARKREQGQHSQKSELNHND